MHAGNNTATHGGNNTHLMMQDDLAVNAPYPAVHTVVHVWQQPSTFSVHLPDLSCMRATQASHAGVLMEATSGFCMLSWNVPWQVVEFVREEAYARFTCIIFNTAPTGHTLLLAQLECPFAGS